MAGLGIARRLRAYCPQRLAQGGWPRRTVLARTGYKVLVNKYYLDELFVNGIVRKIQYPIAKAAYWVNQNVIDGVVNAAGIGSRKVANFVYDNIDQKVVDGLVNGAGAGAEAGGAGLRQHPDRPGPAVRRLSLRSRRPSGRRPRRAHVTPLGGESSECF